MSSDIISTLLRELAKEWKLETLELDSHNTCLLKLQNGMQLYLEPHRQYEEHLIASINIGEVPPGRYREELLALALAANSLPYPRFGNFGYSPDNNQLIIFELLCTREQNGEKLAQFLESFINKAKRWKEALVGGTLPEVQLPPSTTAEKGSGMFGLA